MHLFCLIILNLFLKRRLIHTYLILFDFDFIILDLVEWNKIRYTFPFRSFVRVGTAKHLSTRRPYDLWQYYSYPATLSIK